MQNKGSQNTLYIEVLKQNHFLAMSTLKKNDSLLKNVKWLVIEFMRSQYFVTYDKSKDYYIAWESIFFNFYLVI